MSAELGSAVDAALVRALAWAAADDGVVFAVARTLVTADAAAPNVHIIRIWDAASVHSRFTRSLYTPDLTDCLSVYH